jgi:hypothetical protein
VVAPVTTWLKLSSAPETATLPIRVCCSNYPITQLPIQVGTHPRHPNV